MPKAEAFKVCPMCSTVWETRDDFLDDLSVEINGYQVDLEKLEWSLFYFTHAHEKCRSTMAIEASSFLSLYSGKKYLKRKTGSKDCPGYCLDKEQLSRCAALCECAFNREVIQIILDRRKQAEDRSE